MFILLFFISPYCSCFGQQTSSSHSLAHVMPVQSVFSFLVSGISRVYRFEGVVLGYFFFIYIHSKLKGSTTKHLKQAFEMPPRCAPTGVPEYALIHVCCHIFGPDELSVSFPTPLRCQANSRSSAIYRMIRCE